MFILEEWMYIIKGVIPFAVWFCVGAYIMFMDFGAILNFIIFGSYWICFFIVFNWLGYNIGKLPHEEAY